MNVREQLKAPIMKNLAGQLQNVSVRRSVASLCLVIFLLIISTAAFSNETVLVANNASKAVLIPKEAVNPSWKEDTEFDDSSWRPCIGRPGGVGYETGSGYEGMITLDVENDMYQDGDNPTSSCYLRIKFSVASADLAVINSLALTMMYDDGYVVYINGHKVAEANAPESLEWNSSATEAIEYDGPTVASINRHVDKLVAGENLLAIHGLNASPSSSDFLINAKLVADTEFVGDFSSNLPIIDINTNGQQIPDDVRIVADMGIIYNENGQRNLLTDPYNHYNGKIGIELRGSTSKNFPKKPYRIETQDELGENLNVSIFGMPEENDWVLHNPYSDKSLIRNVMAYKISNDIGRYASRTQLCEVFVNGDYKGVYVFMEKLKRDKNRVDIARLDEDDVSADSLTGGYIIKVDKLDGEQVDGFEGKNVFYQYHYPRPVDIKPEQKTYIKNFITRFEARMKTDNFDSPASGYPKYIDIDSAVDFFIINEVTRNIDGYRLSAFMWKDRDSKGGKLIMGPVWDFNLSFGNGDYFDGWKTNGWNLDYLIIHTAHEYTPPFWWDRLHDTDEFKSKLYARWTSLRAGVLQTDVLTGYIDALEDTLAEAQARNFAKWPILGTDVWPNWYWRGVTVHAEQIEWMKTWLIDRLAWMDAAIDEYKTVAVVNSGSRRVDEFALLQNYPNPFNPSTTINYTLSRAAFITISIYNLNGRLVKTIANERQNDGTYTVQWNGLDAAGDVMPSGAYIYQIKMDAVNETFIQSKKMLLLR
jgi:hypothetical protein